jgi:hypothetical protein
MSIRKNTITITLHPHTYTTDVMRGLDRKSFMKSDKTRPFTLARKTRKRAKKLRPQTSLPLRPDSERRLRWLLGFALESSELRTLAERRRVCQQLGAYLDGLYIRCAGQNGDGSRVMELGDTRTPEDLPMKGKDHQKSFDEKLALIRSDVRRVVQEFLSVPNVSLRVTAEIAWQRILETDPGHAPTCREQWVTADVREGITFRLLEDLAKAGALVRECPATGCGTVFVRRYRQEFCSTACRNRTNFHRWYQRTRKQRKGTVMSPHGTRLKRPTHPRRARIIGKPTRRTKSA